MTKEEAQKLEELFDGGYLVIIEATPFLDGPVQCIGEEEEGEHAGKICYSSDNFVDRPLDDVNVYEVSVYAPAMDKWSTMERSMEQDRRDAWEHTLWLQEKEAKENAPKFYEVNYFGPFDAYNLRVNGEPIKRKTVDEEASGLLPDNPQFNGTAHFRTKSEAVAYLDDLNVPVYWQEV